MKKFVFNTNLPEKIDLSALRDEAALLDSGIEVNYIGELNWVGGKKDGLNEPARVSFIVPNNITEEQLLSLLANHRPLEHKPDPMFEEAMKGLQQEKEKYLEEVFNKMASLEKRIEDLENN